MLNPLISTVVFLIASISAFIAAVISVLNESSVDNIYLATSLICGLLCIITFRKHKREKSFNSH